jgi:uncharacterized membrane protein required for colicin V production
VVDPTGVIVPVTKHFASRVIAFFFRQPLGVLVLEAMVGISLVQDRFQESPDTVAEVGINVLGTPEKATIRKSQQLVGTSQDLVDL